MGVLVVVVVVVVIEFTIPAKRVSHSVLSLSERCKNRNASLIPRVTIIAFQPLGGLVCPSDIANRNPTGVGLLVRKMNRFFDYDNDNDNDNDNDCFCFVRKISTNRTL